MPVNHVHTPRETVEMCNAPASQQTSVIKRIDPFVKGKVPLKSAPVRSFLVQQIGDKKGKTLILQSNVLFFVE